jgi:hypothetical protein
MKSAQFVAIRISHISEIKLPHGRVSYPRGILAGRSAIGHTRRVPRIDCLLAVDAESNRSAVGPYAGLPSRGMAMVSSVSPFV